MFWTYVCLVLNRQYFIFYILSVGKHLAFIAKSRTLIPGSNNNETIVASSNICTISVADNFNRDSIFLPYKTFVDLNALSRPFSKTNKTI